MGHVPKILEKTLLKRMLEGIDSCLNYAVLSMNRLNQTKPTTFSILQF
jgi:hypothetical protein